MKKLLIFTVILSCAALLGCSKDAEINSFITEFEAATQEITTKLDAGDIEAARKTFDDKKESLKTSWDSIKGARGFQVSKETQTSLTESVTKNVTALGVAAGKAKIRSMSDKDKTEEIDKLLNEYRDIFQM